MDTIRPIDDDNIKNAISLLEAIGKNNDFTDTGKIERLKVGENQTIEDIDSLKFVYWPKDKEYPTPLGSFGNFDKDTIFKLSQKAPFGNIKTKKNEFDDNVRLSREIDLNDIFILNRNENEICAAKPLFDIKPDILSDNITIEPYKLVIYKNGDFFKKHRDSMPNDKMIGTIVLSLTSDYTGGSLVVMHQNQKKTFDLKEKEWVFLYGNCEHEILPVESGTRIVLTYRVYSDYSANSLLSVVSKDTKAIVDKFIQNLIETCINSKDDESSEPYSYRVLDFAIPLLYEYGSDDPKLLKSSDEYLYNSLKGLGEGVNVMIKDFAFWNLSHVEMHIDEDANTNYDYTEHNPFDETDYFICRDLTKLYWKTELHEDHIWGNGCGKDYKEYSRMFLCVKFKEPLLKEMLAELMVRQQL